MLERAAAWLETGGKHFPRGPKQSLRSRRMLHSAFWQHGAGDIDLPGWWTSLLLVQQQYEREEESRCKEAMGQASGKRGLFLDFLYPAKTMAYIKKISTFGLETWERHQARQGATRGYRQYTSMAGEAPQTVAEVPPFASPGAQEEEGARADDIVQETAQYLPSLPLPPSQEARISQEGVANKQANVSDPLEDLKELLQSQRKQDYSLAWQLYMRCPGGVASLQLELIIDLLSYLSSSDQVVEAERFILIFEMLPADVRPSAIVDRAIIAHLRLGNIGAAARIHDELVVMPGGSRSNRLGTRLLLAHCIHRGYSQLAIHVYESFLASQPQPSVVSSLWDQIRNTPQFVDKVLSLVAIAKQAPEIGWGLDKANGRFIALLARHVFVQEPGPESEDAIMYSKFDTLLSNLRELNLLDRDFFETMLEHLYSMPARLRFSNRPIIRLIWFRYRSHPDYSPSRALLRRIASHVCNLEAGPLMEKVRADCDKFHGGPWTDVLLTLMAAYARMGDAERVHSLFAELREQIERIDRKQIDRVNPLRPLVHVHARRAELPQAHEQFDRIHQEFGLTPDVYCWSILIHAHARVDDLEGSLQCLNDMVKSACKPNEYTFGPLMNLCATRGDLDTVQELMGLAETSGIKPTPAMMASLVLAYINIDDIAQAEAVAAESSKSLLPDDQTIIWTVLLNGYALRKDLKSLMRVYRQMKEANVPLDSMTYAALMHGLAIVHQTDAAYKILRVVMPQNQIRVLAFHYAIVMSGFTDQGDHVKALRAHHLMLERKIKPTLSTRVAHLKATALAEFDRMRSEGISHPAAKLFATEDLLDEILEESDSIDVASRQPRKGIGHTPLDQAHPSSYFEVLISLYGKSKSFEAVRELYDRYIQEAQSSQPQRRVVAPVQLLTALMHSHLRASEHEEMAKCWELAKEQADRLVKLWRSPDVSSNNQSYSQRFVIPAVRRLLLSGCLYFYIRSLAWQSKIAEIKSVTSSVLSSGYALDNQTWNAYVQALSQSRSNPDILLAFETCEEQLMPGWTGWAVKQSGSDQRGGKKLGLPHIRTKGIRHGQLLPQYKTLVMLAGKLAEMKGSRLVTLEGLGVDDVRKVAPKTVHAIMGMPRVDDRLQSRLLRPD